MKPELEPLASALDKALGLPTKTSYESVDLPEGGHENITTHYVTENS